MAGLFVGPAHAYERCKAFDTTELKAMTSEGLEKAYCSNEDRLIEILRVLPVRSSEETKRDRDACWETLLKLTAQSRFDREGNCPGAVQAGVTAGGQAPGQDSQELLRHLGIAGEKDVSK